MGRTTAMVAAMAVAASTVVAAGSPAQAAPSAPSYGVNVHALWADLPVRDALLDKLAAAGVTWARVDVGWNTVEKPGPGQYEEWYLERFSDFLTAATARGIKTLAVVSGSPAWANGGASTITAPRNPDDYGRAMGYLAGRFAGRVPAWQLWNEPNHKNFYSGTNQQYVAMLASAYPRVKAADPAALVVLGGPSKNDVPYLRSLYDLGAKPYFDVLATNPYQGRSDTAPETPMNGSINGMTAVTMVRDLMVEKGDGAKKIWFTEFGWSTHANTGSEPVWHLGVSEATQADFTLRALELVRVQYPYVERIFQYNARNRTDGNIHNNNYGIVRTDLSEKLVYGALKRYHSRSGSPLVSIAEATAPEGSASGGTLRFPISLSWASTSTVTVPFRVVAGSAGLDDVVTSSGSVQIPAGSRDGTASVTVRPDLVVEPSEQVTVVLDPPTGATLGRASAAGTITNDDAGLPSVNAGDATAVEGDAATGRSMSFDVTLSSPQTVPVTVVYEALAGTADNSDVWLSGARTLTFPAGTVTAKVYVGIRGDNVAEPTESFTMQLSAPTNAILGRAAGRGTITDDD